VRFLKRLVLICWCIKQELKEFWEKIVDAGYIDRVG